MSFQIKFVSFYFSVVLCLVLTHGSLAQHTLPDAQIKTNVSSITNALEYINALQPKRFEYNTHAFQQLKLPRGGYYGFMAEEFKQVFPFMVSTKPTFFTTGKNTQRTALIQEIDMEKLVPVLVGAIQEQQVLIQQLQEELTSLKEQMQR
ncbi:MAG: hypothetical protein COW65_03730 [Cytophagales bacterium CG18_big_fil_WC_8_21_14_2_50_42_9]|nr:MAG: hypothetical protein COW65_03730 [Cytophagales bacterium CG18_big_fil_WC_8_21_14_2_50_42_9]